MSEATTRCNEPLREDLRSNPDWRLRRQAALGLVRQPDGETYQDLVSALQDRDPDVRHAAVLALGQLGDERAVEVLCRPRMLDDPSADIRWATVTALGQLGSLAIANVLSRALDDPEWVVRNQALLTMSDFIRRVPETVDGEQVRSLIRLLAIRDAEVHGLVVDALARRSTRGLDEMVEALRGMSRMVRAGIAEALGLSEDPRAVAPLIDATRDPVGMVRREAARALGRLNEPAAVEPLIVVLADPDRETCQAAIEALVAIGKPAVLPLCTALAHAAPKVHRRNIILALGGIRDSAAVIHLLNSLSSTYYVVRRAAIAALSGYRDEVVDDLIDMVQVSQVPVDALVQEALGQGNKRMRLRALRAIGELKNAATIRPLRRLMEEPDRDIVDTTQEALSKIGLASRARNAAIVVLGNIGSRKAVPVLTKALLDYSEHVRGEAARSLAKLGDASTVKPLITVMANDHYDWVRREAAAALRAMAVQSQEVAEAFRAALADEHWEVRAEAARALGRIDDPASVPRLLEVLLDSSYTVQISAVHALANLERYAVPELLAIAAGPDSPRRTPALQALIEAAAKDLVPEVTALRSCPEPERQQRAAELQQRWR